MENYKSIHTGEQIDEAIAQVLSKNFPFSIVATADDVHLQNLENGQHIFIQDENKLYRYKNSTLVEDAINYILDLGWFNSLEDAYAEAAAYDDSTKEYIYKDKRILFAEFPIHGLSDRNKTEKIIILQNTSYHRTALFLFKDGKFYLRHLGWDMDGVYLNPTWIETLPSHLAWDDETHTLSLKQWGETINEELQIPLADEAKAGLMSKEDKVKLDGIAKQANNYSLPAATASTRGGIKIGYSSSANHRAVQLDSEKAYVNIPNVTITQSGLMSSSDKTKLDSIKVYRKLYKSLSPAGHHWFLLAEIGDWESSIFLISTNGHSDVLFAAATGWEGDTTGTITILNTFIGTNNNYAHIRGVRMRKESGSGAKARIEIELNGPIANYDPYVDIIATVYTSSDSNNPLKDTLNNVPSAAADTIIQSYELKHRTLLSEKIEVKNIDTETINGRALANVASTGSYNDLSNKPTIPSAVTEATVSGWGFTKNTGTYSKPSTGIPKSDLHTDVLNALNKANTALLTHQDISGKQDVISDLETIRLGATKGATALQSYEELYKGTVTGVTINGETKTPTNGIVNIGTVITNHQDISGKQDTLISGVNIKTINGESIIGSGNVDLSNYATIEHVNTLIGNINSILTSIINL